MTFLRRNLLKTGSLLAVGTALSAGSEAAVSSLSSRTRTGAVTGSPQ